MVSNTVPPSRNKTHVLFMIMHFRLSFIDEDSLLPSVVLLKNFFETVYIARVTELVILLSQLLSGDMCGMHLITGVGFERKS